MTTEPTPPTPRRAARDLEAIDRAAACCKDAIEHASVAQFSAVTLLKGTDTTVRDAAGAAVKSASEAMNLLVSVGAKSPVNGNRQQVGQAQRFDLSALATLTDPDAPRLLALLEEAQSVAEGIDARRGRVVDEGIPLQPGESRGTDLAETISNLAQRVRVEAHGPKGRE